MNKEELIKKFGKGVDEIPGLVDFLTSQSAGIEDVHALPKQGVAAFCLDKHWWSGSSGIGMAAIVGIFRDGETISRSFTYRDQYNARLDDWSLSFHKVKVTEITKTSITVKAVPGRDYSPRTFTFEIKAKSKSGIKPKTISETSKEKFAKHIKTQMERVVANNQHKHPLFTIQTQVTDNKVDHESKLAAFILLEQIDTDRCTPHGSGWLGDQYRYSLWTIKDKDEAKRIHEDHAYNKDRGCDLRGLRIYKGKVYITNWEGKELQFNS